MLSAPDIECSIGVDGEYSDPRYQKIKETAEICLLVYFFIWGLISGTLVSSGYSKNPGLGYMGFMGDKYEKRFFFWEMVIVGRKLALMSVFLLNTFEFAWLFGSAVLICAVVMQAAAKPYEDKFTDWAEFLTLVANLLILQTGPLFKLLAMPDRLGGRSDEDTAGMQTAVEAAAVVMMFGAVGYTAVAERHVLNATRRSKDYKETMVDNRLQEAQDYVERLIKRKAELKDTNKRLAQERQIGQEVGVRGGVGQGANGLAGNLPSATEMDPAQMEEYMAAGKLFVGAVVKIRPEVTHSLPIRNTPGKGSNHVYTWEAGESTAVILQLKDHQDSKSKPTREWARILVNDKEQHAGWVETKSRYRNKQGEHDVHVEFAERLNDLPELTVWLGEIPRALADEESIIVVLSEKGLEVLGATVRVKDPEKNDGLSWAFVTFVNKEDMDKCLLQDVCGPAGHVSAYIDSEKANLDGAEEGEVLLQVKAPITQSHPVTVMVKVEEHAKYITERRAERKKEKDAVAAAKKLEEEKSVEEVNPLSEEGDGEDVPVALSEE